MLYLSFYRNVVYVIHISNMATVPGGQHRDWEFPCPPGNMNDTLFFLGKVEVLKHWLLSLLLKNALLKIFALGVFS